MSRDSNEGPNESRGRDWGWASLGLGVISSGWAALIVLPAGSGLPAWPAASVGVFALVAARLPGRAWPRGLGSFLGLVGLVVGLVKIAALWGLLELLG